MKKLIITFAMFVLCQSISIGKQYNVLIIQTDEHHFKTLGCYGGKIVKTPNIDWIAKNGAIATSFYATTPVCSPSRASLITGRYPQNTPVTNNNIPLDDNIITFAEVLRRKGYSTGYSGKWHLDGTGKPQWQPKRNFGFSDNRFMFNRGHWKKFILTKSGPQIGSKNKRGIPDYKLNGADKITFSTDWLTDRTIDFINENKEKPFCYMVSFPDPHGPNTVREPYSSMYQDVEVPIPVSINKPRSKTPHWAASDPRITADTVRLIMPKYYGMVKCLDDNIGKILKALRKNNQIQNTIIVFTSDHGDLCGEHGRLNKGVPYEGSSRIPFLIYCPGKISPGKVVNEALSCVDFMPTLLSLTDDKPPQGIEGRNASSLFKGDSNNWNDIAFLRSTSNGQPWLAAITDRYKLIYSSLGQPWLFDLKNDPNELHNNFNLPQSKSIVQKLTKQLVEYTKRTNDSYALNQAIKSNIEKVINQEN